MRNPNFLEFLITLDHFKSVKINNIGLLMMAGLRMIKSQGMASYYWVTVKNMLDNLKMIWFMEGVSFTKMMELSLKVFGKTTTLPLNFELIFHQCNSIQFAIFLLFMIFILSF